MGRSSWTIEEHIKDHVNQLTMIFQKHDLEKHGIILKCLFFFLGDSIARQVGPFI
jgi:hypothetical protein